MKKPARTKSNATPMLLVLLAFALSSCAVATLPEPTDTVAESTLAKIAMFGQAGAVHVKEIDGKSTGFWNTDAFRYVTAGKHRVGAFWHAGTPQFGGLVTEITQVEGTLEAGHLYVVHFDIDRDARPPRVLFHFMDYGTNFPQACVPVAAGTNGPSSPQARACLAKRTR
jgi:hypothetical protein